MSKQSHGFLWADVAGFSLSQEDKEILANPKISGVVLFARNYESPSQLRELTQQIRSVSTDLVITVDQEGGRVQRFQAGFTKLPSMAYWGAGFQESREKASLDFSRTLSQMVKELRSVGVYSSLLPVMDINYERNTVIGHRSFGSTAEIVTELSAFMIDELHALRMPVTGKHFPGHGWVSGDSHYMLPVDERSLEEIMRQDVQPFFKLAASLDAVMLAHVVYEQVDPLPVCFSPFWVQDVLRKQLQYDGLVMCDDLSMEAVAAMGSYADRAERALEAGCDVLLACNSRGGVIDILDHVPFHKSESLAKRLAHYSRFACGSATM